MIKDILENMKQAMESAIESLKEDYEGIRSGRATTSMVDGLVVDYYGSSTPLKSLAAIAISGPRSIQITPYDKSAINVIESAVSAAEFNPSSDGNAVHITLSELTQEKRLEYVKLSKTRAEEARVSVRNSRRNANHDLDKLKKEIGEDEIERAHKDTDSVCSDFVKQIDNIQSVKENQLLDV